MKDTAQTDVQCVHASIAQHTTHSREKDTNSAHATIVKVATNNVKVAISSAKAVTSLVHATIVRAAISLAKAVISSVKAATSLVLATTAKVATSNVKAVINLVKVILPKGEPEEGSVPVLQTIILMLNTA